MKSNNNRFFSCAEPGSLWQVEIPKIFKMRWDPNDPCISLWAINEKLIVTKIGDINNGALVVKLPKKITPKCSVEFFNVLTTTKNGDLKIGWIAREQTQHLWPCVVS